MALAIGHVVTLGVAWATVRLPTALLAVAIVALSLYLSPWAERRRIEFERQLESRDDLAVVTPQDFVIDLVGYRIIR